MLTIQPDIITKATNIKLVLTDVDGVLTNGILLYGHHGEEIKQFHVRDGLGVKLLENNGVRVGVLTGRDAPGLRTRIKDLKITIAEFGLKEKLDAYKKVIGDLKLQDSEVAYIGDDIQDLSVLSAVGLSVCVNDAPSYVKSKVNLCLDKNGGEGAFRELSDIILFSQGKLEKLVG